MSNNERKTRPGEEPDKPQTRRGKPDARIRRTRERLGMALFELICDKPMADVTVQEILDRASVGRSTFYLHFTDKNDLLLSQLEVFLEVMSTTLSERGEMSLRVAPVAEMFEHIGGQNRIYRALSDSGHLHDFFDLAQGHFTRGIERRLRETKRLSHLSARALNARASAAAGSLLTLLRWWIDHGAKETPVEMDGLFHRMLWNGLPDSKT
jgi:AcrR family transcriptional regulator